MHYHVKVLALNGNFDRPFVSSSLISLLRIASWFIIQHSSFKHNSRRVNYASFRSFPLFNARDGYAMASGQTMLRASTSSLNQLCLNRSH